MRCSVAVVAVDFLVTENQKEIFIYIYYIYIIYINKPIFQCSSFKTNCNNCNNCNGGKFKNAL